MDTTLRNISINIELLIITLSWSLAFLLSIIFHARNLDKLLITIPKPCFYVFTQHEIMYDVRIK